jgi:HD-GYP domain-containing protein (c-di-GMP phosphodiesterase class II)
METLKTNNGSPFYSSRGLTVYLKLIKAKYSYISLAELLSYAGMEPYQVEDEGHWFTQEQINKFYEKLVQLTGNKNIAREAGRYAASPDAMGVIRKYILGFISPAQAYPLISKYAPLFTKSSKYESKKIGRNKVEITVTPYEGVHEELYQCENRLGYFDAIATAFNYQLPKIEHPECLFSGGKCCRYIVTWKEAKSYFWEKLRNYASLLIPFSFVSYLIYPDTAPTLLAFSAFFTLALTLHASRIKTSEFSAAIDNLRDSSEQLLEHIDINYNNALLTNEVGLALSKQIDIDSILSQAIQVIEKRLNYDRGMILLANKEKTEIVFKTGFGYNYDDFNMLKEASFHIRPDSKGTFVIAFSEQKPILVNDIEEIKSAISERSLSFAKKMGTKAFICCPIVYEGESLGILVVDNVRTKKPLVQSDINLLMGIAPAIGVSIHNAMLTEAKDRQFRSILQVLSASIDARDFLTAGHSERVTEYAIGICNELGLSKDYTEMIRVASLLHDYGKIGISDSILKKNGQLTDEEFDEIKTHSIKSKKILEQINFEGIYKEVPAIAAHHHEKFDGSGYPYGLSGEQIPLGSRIIAVADVFEAITSKRHYREPMSIEKAFNLLKERCGAHFDHKVVEAFMRYYNKTYRIKEPNLYNKKWFEEPVRKLEV